MGPGLVGTFSGDRIKKSPHRGELRSERTVQEPPISTEKIHQNIENFLENRYGSHFYFIFNDLSESCPCGL